MRLILDMLHTWGLGWWFGSCLAVITVMLGYIAVDVHRERKPR